MAIHSMGAACSWPSLIRELLLSKLVPCLGLYASLLDAAIRYGIQQIAAGRRGGDGLETLEVILTGEGIQPECLTGFRKPALCCDRNGF